MPREISVEIPEDLELSEEEIDKIASTFENTIVDVIDSAQARKIKLKQKTKEKIKVKEVVQA